MAQPTPIFLCDVKNGKLILRNREQFDEYVKSLNGECKIVVSKRTKPATDKQRGYQFGVVYKMIAEASGHTVQEIHEALAFKFLRISDGPLTLRRSTESLTTVEKEEYLANCRQFAQEFYDCRIPLPNEVEVPEYH